jgi:hypothetical protein
MVEKERKRKDRKRKREKCGSERQAKVTYV